VNAIWSITPARHFVELLAVDHMQDRLVADPEPIAGELEIRPGANLEAQQGRSRISCSLRGRRSIP